MALGPWSPILETDAFAHGILFSEQAAGALGLAIPVLTIVLTRHKTRSWSAAFVEIASLRADSRRCRPTPVDLG